jgi:hypothetical protein
MKLKRLIPWLGIGMLAVAAIIFCKTWQANIEESFGGFNPAKYRVK